MGNLKDRTDAKMIHNARSPSSRQDNAMLNLDR